MLERLSASSPILSLSSKLCIHGAWTSPINTCQGSCQELTHQVYQRQQEHMVLSTSVVAPWFIKSNTESAAAHSNARVGGWEGKNKAGIIKSCREGIPWHFQSSTRRQLSGPLHQVKLDCEILLAASLWWWFKWSVRLSKHPA